MAKFESVNLLYKLLKEARYPLTKRHLQDKLECSAATIERYFTELRDTYGQNVEYCREHKGYQLLNSNDDIELPSHLFTSQEINAILLVDQIIDDLEPGFLKSDMQSIRQHLNKVKNQLSGDSSLNVKRIRMINIGKRFGTSNHLAMLTRAVLQRKLISISYASRYSLNDKIVPRILSPQRLTHYRDNWYLDAWCHQRDDLRTFSVERIQSLEAIKSFTEFNIINLSEQQLEDHYAKTFGIFGGQIKHWAVLKFNQHRAQWVAEEIWHKEQKGKWCKDGSYQLQVPYGNDLELIGDILKYGDQVEVLAPEELRIKLLEQAKKIMKLYQ